MAGETMTNDALTTLLRGITIPFEPHRAATYKQQTKRELNASQSIHTTYFNEPTTHDQPRPTKHAIDDITAPQQPYNPAPAINETLFTASGLGLAATLPSYDMTTTGIAIGSTIIAGRGIYTIANAALGNQYQREETTIPSTTNGRLREKLLPKQHD